MPNYSNKKFVAPKEYWYGPGCLEYALAYRKAVGKSINLFDLINERGEPVHVVVRHKGKFVDAMFKYPSTEFMLNVWGKVTKQSITLKPHKTAFTSKHGISNKYGRVLVAYREILQKAKSA